MICFFRQSQKDIFRLQENRLFLELQYQLLQKADLQKKILFQHLLKKCLSYFTFLVFFCQSDFANIFLVRKKAFFQ